VALKNGRYSWQHVKILEVIADTLEKARKQPRKVRQGLRFVNFVKEGEQAKGSVEDHKILPTAGDWQMKVDLDRRIEFPTEVAITRQRPDIAIWSSSTKQVLLVELTVPWEERVEEAYERKKGKYQKLAADFQQRGWRVWCLPVEMGCRGFAGQSWRALRVIGIKGRDKKKLIGAIGRQRQYHSGYGERGRKSG